MPAANTANGPHQPVVNPLRLSIHRNRQTGPMAHDLLKNDACGSTAAGKEADRFPPPPPLAEEGSARAARRKELLLDDEVLDSETWQPRTWVAWRLWAYYVLVTATVGTLWIVGQWSFMRKRLHLLLSRPARQDTCDFIVVTSSKKQGAAVEICEVEAQNEVPIELLTSWSDIRRRRKQNEHVKRSSAGDKGRLMVLYRHTRYFFDPFVSRFLQADNEHYTAPGKVDLRNGLTSREASHRLQLFGRNVIEVPMPSTATLLIRECIHPFVIFQIWAVIVWLTESYWSFSAFIFCAALATAFTNFLEVRRNLLDIRGLSRYSCPVQVLRDHGRVETIDSSLLVPGDVFAIEPDMRLPSCDSVLIRGSCSVNEAMLTGESTVVIKSALPSSDSNVNDALPRNTLFGGSNVAQLRGVTTSPPTSSDGSSPPLPPVLAVVVRTGFESVKGRLVLAILYPRLPPFKVLEQALWFVFGLFVLAMGGFAVNAKALSDAGTDVAKIIQRGCDMVTIVVPPALPLALTVGIAFALVTLRRRDRIVCISPQRVNLAGKINAVCFDKTGTLTTEGLQFDCIRQVKRAGTATVAFEQAEVRAEAGTLSTSEAPGDGNPLPSPLTSGTNASGASSLRPSMRALLACCHSLTFVKGELSGDPLEVQTFAFSGGDVTELHHSQNHSHSHRQQPAKGGAAGAHENDSDRSLPLPATAVVRVPVAAPASSEFELSSSEGDVLSYLDHRLIADATPGAVRSPSLRRSSLSAAAAISSHTAAPLTSPNAFHAASAGQLGGGAAVSRRRSSTAGGRVGVDLSVLQIFEFVPALQRMGVLCALGSSGGSDAGSRLYVSFVKGAPEMIHSLCRPSTLPADYFQQLKAYTSKGLRVLSAGVRLFSEDELLRCFYDSNGRTALGFTEALARLRVLCESDLVFAGLIALENRLKDESAPTIATLQLQGGIPCTMITGDNATSAVCVARKCGIVSDERSRCRVFIGDLAPSQVESKSVPTPRPPLEPVKAGGHALLDGSSIISPQPSPTNTHPQPAAPTVALPGAVAASGALANTSAPLSIGIVPFGSAAGGPTTIGASGALLRADSFSSVASSSSCGSPAEVGLLPRQPSDNDGGHFPITVAHSASGAEVAVDPRTLPAADGAASAVVAPSASPRQHQHAAFGVVWTDVDEEDSHLDPMTLLPSTVRAARGNQASAAQPSDSTPYCLALTGRAFAYLQECVREGTLDASYVQRVCLHTHVFARMSPEHKAAAVEVLQSTGLYVAMVGDGANDSLALRAAHVGVSLSQAEASVSAPFSSLNPNISCVVPLLCEGRGALATSFCLFGFMALYSTIQFANALLIVFRASFLSNNEYLWQDLIIVFVLAITLGNTPSATRLTIKRPSADLLSLYNVTLSVGFILLTFLFQAWAYAEVQRQPWYGADPAYPLAMNPEQDEEGTNSVIPETTTVFLMSSLQYVAVAAIFSWGLPWKRNTFTSNWAFTGWLALVLLLSFVLFLGQPEGLYRWIGLQTLPIEWNRTLFGMSWLAFLSYFAFVALITWARRKGWFTAASTFLRGLFSPSSAAHVSGSLHKRLKKEWQRTMRKAGIQPLANFGSSSIVAINPLTSIVVARPEGSHPK